MFNLCPIRKASCRRTDVVTSHSNTLVQFVSQDIFTFGHKQYLITVDHYSNFYVLDELVDILSTTVINLTKAHFALHSIPLCCLTDNGPQFVSHEYKKFAQTFDFEHVTFSPYWSRSNGKAEAAVNDAKSLGGYSGFQVTGMIEGFFGFQIFDSGIFLGTKIWQAFFWVA